MLLSGRAGAGRNRGWGSADLMRRAIESCQPCLARGAVAAGVVLRRVAGSGQYMVSACNCACVSGADLVCCCVAQVHHLGCVVSFLALEVLMSSTEDHGIVVANEPTQAVYCGLYSPAGVRWLDEWKLSASAFPSRSRSALLASALVVKSYSELPSKGSPVYQLCIDAVSNVDFDLIARVVLSESEGS